MPQGLQVFDASGNVMVDLTTSITRVLGMADIGTSNGSITDTGFSTGIPWWVVLCTSTGSNIFSPSIGVSGNVLSYTFPLSGLTARIIYGVR